MLIQGQTGLINANDGSNPTIALGKQGSAMVSELHGRYYELALRGFIFHLPAASVTVTAANVSPLAATTGQTIAGLWNPPNSGKNLAVLKVGAATVSGTPGGPLIWNYAPNQNITAVANVTPVPALLSQAVGSVARGYSNVAMTGMSANVALRDAVNISAVAAAAVTSALMEDTGGDIIVPPGAVLNLAALGLGTAHIVRPSITWAEIPV